MPIISSVATAVPPHRLLQSEARAFAGEFFARSRRDVERLLPVFEHAGIEARYVCMPPEWFTEPHPFEEKNRLYIEWATKLGEVVVRACLERAKVAAAELTHIIFVSTTGLATPSIDSRLINVLELDPHIRRLPLWGLGCGGGASGLATAAQLAEADPRARVMLVAVELCSLTFNHGDASKSNLVATALFGDGAAAVLVSGDEAGGGTRRDTGDDDEGLGSPGDNPVGSLGDSPGGSRGSSALSGGLRILGARSTTWPGSLDVMGWNFDNVGMQVVFSRAIPNIVHEKVHADLSGFLAGYGMELADLRHLIAHPGGVKVIEAYEEALGLGVGTLALTRGSLRDFGNMSSASVLFVLEQFMKSRVIGAGERGVLTALGPGFTAQNLMVEGV